MCVDTVRAFVNTEKSGVEEGVLLRPARARAASEWGGVMACVCCVCLAELLEERVRDDTCARVDGQLELAHLGVDVLHELDDEVDQLLLLHVLRVEIRDEERKGVALGRETETDGKREGAGTVNKPHPGSAKPEAPTDIHTCTSSSSIRDARNRASSATYGSGRAAQDDEVLGALAQESGEAADRHTDK